MRPIPSVQRRRGSILPVLALLIVSLCGFTALSVEVATIAMVKVQCQNAADTSAMAGARALNGSTSQNLTGSNQMAITAAQANYALGINPASNQISKVNFVASEITFAPGTYHYNSTSQTFYPAYTLQSGENYNLVKTTVQRQVKNAFFAVDAGANNSAVTPTIVATAVAAHRPRDVAIVLDFSSSMNDESDLWYNEPWFGSYEETTNNADTNIPTFGHYTNTALSALVSPITSPAGTSNMSIAVNGMPNLASSYFATPYSTTPSVSAFTSAPSTYASAPLGDIPVTKSDTNSGTNFAANVNDIFSTNYTTSYSTSGSAFSPNSFENGLYGFVGYDFLYWASNNTYGTPAQPSGRVNGSPAFSGYTVGPNYWGKTFFIWPPDPRPSKDWRQLYFIDSSTGGGVTNNTTLWNPGDFTINPNLGYATFNNPYNSINNYKINYKAILNWIKNVGPNPFPTSLHAGHIVYYSSIPTDVPASAYDHNQLNNTITDPSQRFWKEYIDWTLGVWRDNFGNVHMPMYGSACSMAPDYNWGTTQVTAKPTGTAPNGSKLAYMNYTDNPPRPRHRFWFGPMTMMQFISNTGKSPGTVRDISTYSTKLGVASVLQDVLTNHPNDEIAMIYYARPQYSNEPKIGRFSNAIYNLNRDYTSMINSLWYPPNTSSSEVSIYDANGIQAPASVSDEVTSTAMNHGLMLAYNQLSSSPTLSGLTNGGGQGRVGAKKLVILETDGYPTVNTQAGFTNSGANNSYFNIQPGQSYTAASTLDYNVLYQVAQSICNTASGSPGTPNSVVSNPGYPGFATSSKTVKIETIAFGVIFQIPSSFQDQAVSVLQSISTIGGTTFPSSPSDPTNGYKYCIGTLSQRVTALQNALSTIMNDGESISLVQ